MYSFSFSYTNRLFYLPWLFCGWFECIEQQRKHRWAAGSRAMCYPLPGGVVFDARPRRLLVGAAALVVGARPLTPRAHPSAAPRTRRLIPSERPCSAVAACAASLCRPLHSPAARARTPAAVACAQPVRQVLRSPAACSNVGHRCVRSLAPLATRRRLHTSACYASTERCS